ncbi:amino acid adenylation domain-containing protein [Nocardia sp. NBC_01009]|uniref:amino acid adenylation domain-containing protein n=1 Tax=Nocardia sp. NBC_01009 TaxID=2975996 RepID=UPI0038660BFC|nr:amino acid adenylation domain-containing protein [Nocardia sp. NBC_01009]
MTVPRPQFPPDPESAGDSEPNASVTQLVPLSAGQRGLWLAQQLSPDVPICEAQYLEFHGDLDLEVLRKTSIQAGLEFQSGYLRLVEVDGEPYQLFDPSLDSTGPLIDMRGEPDPMAAGLQWMRQEYTAPLDMTRDRLLSWVVVQVGDRHFLWYCRIHHVALDGYAAMMMMNRVAALYTAAVQGQTAEPYRAADLRTLYEADRSYRESKRFTSDQAYWVDRLADVEDESSLADGYAPARADSVVATAELPTATVGRIDQSAKVLDATPAAVVIAAFGSYLARMTGRDEVLVNIPVSGRTTAVLRRSGGVFVNLVPLPIVLGAQDTVATLVRRVQSDLIGALRHQRCGLTDIRAAGGYSGQRRFAGPMVNVMYFPQELRLGPMTAEFHILSSGPVDDLLVDLYQTGDPPQTILHFLANPNLYTGPELSAHYTRFVQFLDAFAAAAPDTDLGQVHPDSARHGAGIRRRRENLAFWRATLADLPTELSLPTDRSRPVVATNRGATIDYTLDAALMQALEMLARQQNSSLFMVVHSTLAVLLARLSGTTDIPIGTPIAGRDAAELDDAVGMFVNTLVLRTEVDLAESFTDLLCRIKQVDLDAFGHADIPFEQLVDQLASQRSRSRHPLFQVMLAFHNLEQAKLEPPGLSRFDLQVLLSDKHDSGEMAVVITYATDLFDAQTIDALAHRWFRILESAATDPTIPVGMIEVLEPAERADLLARSGAPPTKAPTTLATLLTTAAARDPDATAIYSDGRQLSYRELDERSNRLARLLIQRGVGPEDVVAIGIPRSPESVFAVWAVAKSGAAFLPIDPTYPLERITHMLTDSKAAIGLTVASARARLPDDIDWLTAEHLDETENRPVTDDNRVRPLRPHNLDAAASRPVSDSDRVRPLRVDDIAYVIYTSGSTGLPKGVAVTHRGLCNCATEHQDAMSIEPRSRILHLASPSFDVSVLELLLALCAGATMVIAPSDIYGGDELAELLDREHVSHVLITPSALSTIDQTRWPLPDLRYLLVGGEGYGSELVERWSGGRSIFNEYGPTEATIAATLTSPLVAGELVTIGGPIRGVSEWILDQRLQPVPAGVAGELYIAGTLLARGYQHRASLTAQRFIACPWMPGERMYRTGDVVRWTTNGSIQHLGRSDFQVKIRGLRIELGEIDATLITHESVGFATTIGHHYESGTQTLVSYVLAAQGHSIDTTTLTEHLANRLPSYMIPSSIMVLDRIPLTPVGKLDRKALPDPEFTDTTPFRAPQTPTEHTIAKSFAEVLKIDTIGLDDSFFALGGDSMIATRVAARLGAALHTEIPVRLLFEASTVAALATRIEQHSGTGRQRPPLIAGPRPDLVPLAPAQQRMWFFNQYDTRSGAYNVPIAIRLRGELSVDALRSAVVDVLRRHESLRTRYPDHDGMLIQLIEPADEVDPELALTSVPPSQLDATVTEFVTEGFDVSIRAPVRARLFRVAGGEEPEYVLAVVVHHIAADGFSMKPLARDVTTAYIARIRGEVPSWTPLPVQYADYALWQRATLGPPDDPESLCAQQIRYWTETLDGVAEELCLPADRSRPVVASNQGATIDYTLDAELVQVLERLARQQSSSLFMVIHSTLATLLARLSGMTDISIGTPIAGRGAAELDDVIGMFVNTLVLRTEIDLDESFTDLLGRVRQVDLDAFGHADVPFEQLVDQLAPQRSQSRHPLFQVMLAFQNLEPVKLELPGLDVSMIDLPNKVSRFDLQVVLSNNPDSGQMTAAITYATDLFDAATINSLMHRWIRILESVAADPTIPVGMIEVLEPAERAGLLARSGAPPTAPTTLADLLTTAAARDPDATAIVFDGQQLSYRELDERSNRLARLLIQRGIGPEDLVAIGIPRSPDSVLAVWAVAKSGAAFLPIDPTYPLERITHMLTDSNAAIGLTVPSVRTQLPDDIDWLTPDNLDEAEDRPVTDSDRIRPLRVDDIAYVIYTSGSTGLPKGVAVTHYALSNCATQHKDAMSVETDSRILHLASPSFDVSVLEMLMATYTGATMVITPSDIYGGDELAELLDREHVSHVLITPSALSTIDQTRWPLPDLRYLLVGGEGYGTELVERWSGGGRDMLNEYGPTETTITTNQSAPLVAGELVTIGGPIRGVSEWVLDQRLQPVPRGVAGELYIAGALLARGYHRRAGLTAERFVACPWMPGERMYRTGDVVRWTPDGSIQHLGRSDFQVKIRGLRIELGEIDATLTTHETVGFATTIGHHNESGAESLVSYVLAAQGHSIDTSILTEHLTRRLPSSMVPSSIMVLDRIPLTPVGKLDRTALPDPVFHGTKAFRAPETPIERTIAESFTNVLGIDRVGLDDSFFALGGDSIMSIQLVTRARATGVVFSAREVFERKTVAGLAEIAVLDDSAAAASLPSDLELVRLGQSEIQRLEDSYPALSDIWPLTPLQEGLLFHALVSEESMDAYLVQLVLELRGQVDPERLRRAGQMLLDRHANLRTAFVTDTAAGPVQVVNEDVEASWSQLDLSGLDDGARNRKWDRLMAADRATRFDPGRAPLLRWMLVTTGPEHYRLVLTNHHLLLDGWSTPLLLKEFLILYATDGDAAILPRTRPYRDFLAWIVGRDQAASLDAWARAFDGADGPTLVAPADPSRPYTESRDVLGELTEEQTASLTGLARARGITLNTVIQMAWAIVLGALTSREDVTFGATVSGRPPQISGIESMIGLFINTLPVRVRLDPAESLGQLLDRIQAEQAALLDHHYVGLTDIERVAGPGTVFDTITVFESFPIDRGGLTADTDIGGMRLLDVTGTDAAHYPLGVVARVDTRLHLKIKYLPELFDQDTMDATLQRVLRVIGVVADDPDLPLARLDLLSPAEHRELTPVSGDPAVPEQVLPKVLAAAAERDPGAVAVVYGERRWTYGELDAESNRLARLLIGRGVGPEASVAVGLPRSVDSVLALWAVAKSGAAFVPVDPQYPTSRVEHMLADSGVAMGITLSEWRDRLPGPAPWLVLDESVLEAEVAGLPALPVTDAERTSPVRVDNAAYVIYTSGSTGMPKGVVVSHRGLANLVAEQGSRFDIGPSARVLHFASPSFDAAMLEHLWAFGTGGRLVIAPPTIYGGGELAQILLRTKVTHAALTPAALGTVDPDGLEDLGTVVVGGEAPSSKLVSRWAPGRRFFNTYGPAEATIMTDAGAPMVAGEAVTIGGPIHGVGQVVLDAWLRPVPVGVVGELYLAGPGLARGYRNGMDLTASRFVADPFAGPGQRMYRTGDLMRWLRLPEGSLALDYVGRSDFQVKVRGFRVELGEVESALRACPGVAGAVATVHRDPAIGDRLIGYVVPELGTDLDAAAVLAFVGERLASHLVPATVVVLDALPVTANGKLDRTALPAPDFTTRRGEFRAPATEVETALASLFAEVLGIDTVGLDDSFFALGGDSIMSIQLVTRARAAGVVFSTREVFERKTVAGLAEIAVLDDSAAATSLPTELPGGGVGLVPVTPIMCWMFERGGFDRFCQWVMLTLPTGIDATGIGATVQAVIDQHDMLRSRLRQEPAHTSGWALRVQPTAMPAAGLIRRVPVDAAPDSSAFATLADAEANAAAERLDPAAGVMLQLVWFDWDGQPGRLLVVAHHLVIDGVSWRILVPDFAAAWAQLSVGQRPRLAPVGTSMRRWAHALNAAAERLDELDWWRSTLGVADPPIGTRPIDPVVDVQATVATVEVALPTAVTRAVLTTLPRAFHGNVDDALIAGLALALTRWQCRHGNTVTEALLTLESHGRHDTVLPGADLTRTVGWFTTTYPVRLDLSDIDIDDAFAAGAAAAAVLKSVKEQLRQVPNRGIGYGLLRYLNADTARILRELPTPQLSFNYLGRFDTIPATLRDVGWMPVGDDTGGGAQNPDAPIAALLGINAVTIDTSDGPTLTAAWEYPTGLLTYAEVTDLAGLWRDAVTALAAHASGPGAGGLTPSDVDLVDLDQDAIDRLETKRSTLDDIWPLTPLQTGLLFHAQLADGTLDAYLVQLCVELGGHVDADRLRRAAQTLIGRHPNLRTAFVRAGAGEAVQVVHQHVDVPFTQIDLAERDDIGAALEQLMDTDRRTCFDVTAAPLLRLTLISTAPQQYQLLVSMHHILIDGWSTPLLIRELLTLYATDSDATVLPPVRPYRDYLMWLNSQDQDAAEAAWAQTLDGIAEPTLLAPADRGRRPTIPAREIRVQLSEQRTAALVAVAQQQEATLNTLIEAAWAIVLATSTAREDVVFGTTVSGRPPQIPGVESMIGLFVNTVPVRVRLDHRETLAQLLRRIQTEQASLLDHHHLGLAQIQRVAGPGAMFDTVTVLESYPVDRAGLSEDTDIAGMRVLDVHGHDAAHYPLGLVVHHDTRLHLTFKYLPELFTQHQIDAIADRMVRVLDTIAEHIDLPLTQLQLLSPVERATLVPVHGRPGAVMSVLPQVLTAAMTPDTEAVVCNGVRLSYRELDEMSNRWARVLIETGIGPESFVAIALPRSIDAVTAVWAVAKSGGAFVQIDPTHPPARTTGMVTDSGAAVGLTLGIYRDQLPDTTRWLALDAPSFAAATASVSPTAITDPDRTSTLRPQHPAYLIYTSGSTGTPKGVVVTHSGIANLAADTRERFGLTPTARVLAAAAVSFDVSILEWLSAAAAGATLVLAPAPVVAGTELAESIKAEHVTHAAFTPTVLASLPPDELDTLGTVMLGGEICPPDLAKQWIPDRTVVNCYGATETTITSCADAPMSTTADSPMTIGGPTRGFTVVVLDRRLRPVPPGAVGELYVSGPGLARGYHKQPTTTAARFVPDPYGPTGTRMYRTGDLVTWAADRTLQYKGRSDLQIKIHGHRIERGDIEAALRSHPDITYAAVAVHTRPDGADQLTAYVVPTPHTTPDTIALTTYLATRLPTHMIPTTILTLDRIPLTPTGKLDYKALPAPERRPSRFRSPSTPLEATVCDAFTQTLDIERVGVDDGFFTLGGNSLAATQLVARLAESTGADVPLQWVFTDPTPQSLARRIDTRRRGLDEQDLGDALSVVLPLRAAGTDPPLFCVHPAIGLAWGFSGLVQHLDPNRPVQGLQSPTLTDPTAEFDTLDQLAARYVREIRSVQPHGPYHLLGYSLGGTIAHAIAVQLRRDGDAVATLAMMDTRVITARSIRTPTPTIVDLLTEFGGLAVSQLPADLTIEAAAELLHRQGGLFTALTPEHLVILHHDYTRLIDLTRGYRPAPFDGDLIYFSSATDPRDDGPSPALAWNDSITGRITEHRIPARHERMTDPDALRAIGLVLAEHFRSTDTPSPETPTHARTSRS